MQWCMKNTYFYIFFFLHFNANIVYLDVNFSQACCLSCSITTTASQILPMNMCSYSESSELSGDLWRIEVFQCDRWQIKNKCDADRKQQLSVGETEVKISSLVKREMLWFRRDWGEIGYQKCITSSRQHGGSALGHPIWAAKCLLSESERCKCLCGLYFLLITSTESRHGVYAVRPFKLYSVVAYLLFILQDIMRMAMYFFFLSVWNACFCIKHHNMTVKESRSAS